MACSHEETRYALAEKLDILDHFCVRCGEVLVSIQQGGDKGYSEIFTDLISFGERAAIMEFEGHISRDDAERLTSKAMIQ